jgi:hypothetical protein
MEQKNRTEKKRTKKERKFASRTKQGRKCMYEVVSKIFRTGAAIYTAVVVAQTICPKRPNCECQVLLRRFAATA